jgi:Kef-type K+ transport system membrane component KefB
LIHLDPIAPALLALACIIAAAKVGAECAARLGQAPVLGELVAGVIVGNLDLVRVPVFEWMATNSTVDMFARLGVILLLFEVGLESTVHEMLRVGWSSLLVAVLGVVTPFGLGWATSAWLIPEAGVYAHAFIGATLTATSVGITARVLKDLGRGRSDERRPPDREPRVLLRAVLGGKRHRPCAHRRRIRGGAHPRACALRRFRESRRARWCLSSSS